VHIDFQFPDGSSVIRDATELIIANSTAEFRFEVPSTTIVEEDIQVSGNVTPSYADALMVNKAVLTCE
jgi:hypothetical protein